jgi:hypothetical protein
LTDVQRPIKRYYLSRATKGGSGYDKDSIGDASDDGVMSRKRRPEWTDFSMEIDGKVQQAHYYVESGVVTVRLGMAELPAQVGGGTALGVARMLLRELVSSAARRPNKIGGPQCSVCRHCPMSKQKFSPIFGTY